MCATAAITPIRATHGREFITHEMSAACTTMAAFAVNPYLINKIAFFQMIIFAVGMQIYLIANLNSLS